MIHFVLNVIRQHYLILFLAISVALFGPFVKKYYKVDDDNNNKNSDAKLMAENSEMPLLINTENQRVLTKLDLAKYDGSDISNEIYLAMFGLVYDVSAGRKHYQPDGSYHYLVGKFLKNILLHFCFCFCYLSNVMKRNSRS